MAYPKNKLETYNEIGGINQKASQYVVGENEVLNIFNMNFIVPGALTTRFGTTLFLGASVSGKITGLYEFERLSGNSYIIATANTNAYVVTSSFNSIRSGLLNNALFDFETFVDRLFMCNGQDFFKTDAVASSNYSLPPGISSPSFGITAAGGGGLSGIFVAGYGYLNERGYYGPASAGITVTLNGISYGSLSYYGMSQPSGFGVTAISLYRSQASQINMYGTTLIPPGSATFTDSSPISTRPAPDYLYFTLTPKYLEIFNNQLFLAGFSSLPSTVFWSDIGEPEGIDPTFNAEFRTNDGDVIRGLKTYGDQLVVGKERSLHRVIGDNPSNFTLQEISAQFGMLSNFATAIYETKMLFLDTKGICEYNGANVACISSKVEPIFRSMNIDAARNQAYAVHFRDYSEVWFSIPINGATMNNTTVVYDYLVESWTVYDGFQPSVLALARGNLASKRPLYGSYSGSIAHFDQNVFSDLGQGITSLIRTRYHTAMGHSTEQQFRRFFLDQSTVLGLTQMITIGFQADFATTISATFGIFRDQFQSRVDFGIAAKSLAAVISQHSASLSLRVNGYTMESRYQRSV